MKKSIFYSIPMLKCPRCRTGNLFPKLVIAKPLDMHKSCEFCNQKFILEPGFYWGAMFISYIISAFSLFGMLAIFLFVLKWSLNAAFICGVIILLIFYLYIVRISRSVWIHFFVKYDPLVINN